MRHIRYSVAMSLDGYIAGPKGEFDWITIDPEVDFSQMFDQFDTILVGLRIPVKANADSEGNANGIPGRRRTVLGA